MGAQQSSSHDRPKGQGDNEGGTYVKACYYEQLGVDRQASDDEIKKAYRKKALELHPDRNYGDVEASTKLFSEVQSAYQILSDPQERAWYDSHRDAILRGSDIGADEHFEHSIRFTSASDLTILMGKFSPNMLFTDNPNGFYGRLRSLFETIKNEESAVCNWDGLEPIVYPDFGTSGDSYDHVVKPFYTTWASFSTRKTFAWKEVHNTADAPDRRVRRLMEKENKHLREEATKEFNDAVRTLVGFVRKRDPRYIPNKQSVADRQQALRDAAAAQASRSRAIQEAKLNKHVEPAWAHTSYNDEEGTLSDSDPSEEEVVECVTCRKIFKSEKQYEVHEKSKKHIKAVQELRRQMQKENRLFHLDTLNPETATTLQSDPHNSYPSAPLHPDQYVADNDDALPAGISEIRSELATDYNCNDGEDLHAGFKASHMNPHARINETSDRDISEFTSHPNPQEDVDDNYAPREHVEERIAGFSNKIYGVHGEDGSAQETSISNMTVDNITISRNEERDSVPTDDKKKLGKAKAKRAKKLARQQKEDEDQYVCATCNYHFSSKTKLFSHIKEEDHAKFVPKLEVGGSGKISHPKP